MGSGDPYDTIMRQLQMLQHIPRSPKGITADALTSHLAGCGFHIHKRTVQRDLVKLSLCFPLVSSEGKPAYWSWSQQAPALDIPRLDTHAALVFWLIRQQLQPQLPKTTLQWIKPYFAMAATLLDSFSEQQPISDWRNKIRVVHRGPILQPAAVDAAVEEQVYDALLHNRCLTVIYIPRWHGERRRYEIHPLGLVLKDGISYLVCSIGAAANTRLLALHRIETVEGLDTPVTVPEGFDLDDYITSGELGFTEGGNIRLKAVFDSYTALHLQERPLSDDQRLEPYDEGHHLLTATVQNTAELQWWLLGFGDQVEVIEPVSLRQKMLETAQAMVSLYTHH